MHEGLKMLLIFVAVAAVYAGYLYFLYRRAVKFRDQATARVQGRVIGYSMVPGNGPTVEYRVNGKLYRQTLRYQTVRLRSGVTIGSVSELLEPAIVLPRGQVAELMAHYFPVESELTVWYQPNNPSKGYVERYYNEHKTYWGMFIGSLITLGLIIVVFGGLIWLNR